MHSPSPPSKLSASSASSAVNPRFKIRRRIRHVAENPPGTHAFTCYSMTRAGRDEKHRGEVNLPTGGVACDCDDFRFRHAAFRPHLAQPEHHCKHIAPCLDWLVRHGYLARKFAKHRPCHACDTPGAPYELADQNGHPLLGYICEGCIKLARMMDTHDTDSPT